VIRVLLEPTPERREKYRGTAMFHRTWGWIGILSGVAIAGGGVALAVVGASQKNDGDKALEYRNNLVTQDKKNPNGDSAKVKPCDASHDYIEEGHDDGLACDKLASDAQNKIDQGQTLSTVGYVGIGVGGALAVT